MAYAGPTYVGKSTALASAASGSIDFTSSGRSSGDRLYIAIETANEAISAPTGFTQVPTVSPQSRGTAAAAGGVRLSLFEKTSDGTETTVTIADSGDHQYAVGFAFRGTGGNSIAIEASAGNNEALSTSGVFGGVTTGVGNCLIAVFVSTDNDQTGASWTTGANAALTNPTERHDAGAADGQGGGIMLFTGEKEVAGATGNTTSTHANTRAYCWITLALKDASGGADVTFATSASLALASSVALAREAAFGTSAAIALASSVAVAVEKSFSTSAALALASNATLAVERGFGTAASLALASFTPLAVERQFSTSAALQLDSSASLSVSALPGDVLFSTTSTIAIVAYAALSVGHDNEIYGPPRSDNRTITGAARSDDVTITGPARNNSVVIG